LRDSQTLFRSRQSISFALAAPDIDSAPVTERADSKSWRFHSWPNKSRELSRLIDENTPAFQKVLDWSSVARLDGRV